MIDIYAIYTRGNSGKIKIQSIPAGDENGIRLINPTTKGEIGNAESADFSVQNGTPYYNAFIQMRTYIQIVYDGDTIFYGRVLTITNGFFGEQKIHCEGAIAFLNDSYYPGKKKSERQKISILDYMTSVLNNHNSQVNDPLKQIYLGEVPGLYTNKTSSEQRIDNDSREFGQDSWANTKAALEDLKNHYGGAFRVRYENGYCYLDWLNHYYRSTVNDQWIELGVNLIDINSATEVSNIFTAIIPIGKTSSSDNAIYLTDYRTDIHSGNYLKVSDICKSLNPASIYTDGELDCGYHKAEDYKTAINNYGLIFKTVDFQEAHNQEELLTRAAKWIKENYQGGVTTFTVKAIDLHLISDREEKILLGDRVRIRYPVGSNSTVSNIEDRVLTCTGVQYDLFNPENNQYTFGIPANMLSKTYGDSSEKQKKASSYGGKKTGDDEETEVEWMDQVRGWFLNHRIRYKSTDNRETGNIQAGDAKTAPDSLHSTIFGFFLEPVGELDTNGKSKYVLWDPQISGIDSDGTIHWIRNSNDTPKLTPVMVSNEEFSDNSQLYTKLKNRHLFEYVYMEYGVDLTNEGELSKTMPVLVKNKDGSYSLVSGSVSKALEDVINFRRPYASTDPVLQIGGDYGKTLGANSTSFITIDGQGNCSIEVANLDTGMSKKMLEFAANKGLTFESVADLFGQSTGNSKATFDQSGVFTIHVKDAQSGIYRTLFAVNPDSNEVIFLDDHGNPETLRHLELRLVNTENFIGTEVDSGLVNSDGSFITYKMGQEIAKGISDGQTTDLVVAYVQGDEVVIGSEATRGVESIARYVNGNWIKPAHYIENEDGSVVRIEDGNAAGTGAYYGYYDASPSSPTYLEFVDYSDYVKEHPGTTHGPHGEPLVSFTRSGIWDPKLEKFIGGLTTGTDASGKIVSYLKADRLVIGTNPGQTEMKVTDALKAAHVIDENEQPHGLVTETVYTEYIAGVEAHFETIETQYLKTSLLASQIAVIPKLSVRDITGYETLGSSSTAKFGNYYGDHYYIEYATGPSTTDKVDLKRGAHNASITLSGNTYTLHLYDSVGTEITARDGDVRTFSRATTLTGGWSSSVLTVLASPQGNKYTVGFETTDKDNNLTIEANGSATIYVNDQGVENPKRLEQNIDIKRYVYNSGGQPTVTVVHSRKSPMWIDATPSYDAGVNSVTVSDIYGTELSGTHTNDEVKTPNIMAKASNNKTPRIETAELVVTTYSPSGYSYIPDCVNLKLDSKVIGRINVNSVYNKGWSAARSSVVGKTYTVSGKTYNYFPTSSVAAANLLDYFKVGIPNSTARGTIDPSTYYITSGDNDAYIRYNAANGAIVATINHGKYNAGKATKPSAPTFQTRSPSGGYWTTSSIQVASKSSGGTVGDYATVSMAIDNAVPIYSAGNQPCLVSKYGDSVIGIYSLQTFYTDAYNAGKAAGSGNPDSAYPWPALYAGLSGWTQIGEDLTITAGQTRYLFAAYKSDLSTPYPYSGDSWGAHVGVKIVAKSDHPNYVEFERGSDATGGQGGAYYWTAIIGTNITGSRTTMNFYY